MHDTFTRNNIKQQSCRLNNYNNDSVHKLKYKDTLYLHNIIALITRFSISTAY